MASLIMTGKSITAMSKEVIPESQFNEIMDKSILYTDLLGEQHVIRLGLSQSQIIARYAIQGELDYEQN